MLGVIVNMLAAIVGGTLGTLFKKGIPEKITNSIMIAVGMCVVYIGIDGALKGENTLVLIISMLLGTAIGSLIDIDDKINRLGKWVENKFNKGEKKVSIAEGFVTATLLFCVGSMTVVGSLNAGLLGDNQMLYTKSLLDLISGTMIAASCGIGVIFSAIPILIFQGGIVLLAELLSGVLTTPAINEMTCVGSVIIIALGLNLVGISKFKVANFMPAIVLAPLVCMLFEILPFSL
ncbi:MAG: DUF554 domain-containing protein [Clostridia bacterium]|nr:DUF554 domain-containing protein [Clostridia bacterium]MBQ7043499.1 DUF554 domain-containing protein [Clostridia bacterium]